MPTGKLYLIPTILSDGTADKLFSVAWRESISHIKFLCVENECSATIKALEKESKARNQTQIFIETPFRNNRLLKALLKNLSSSTRLCVAIDITGAEELVISKPVKSWPITEMPKLPAIFLF